MSNEALTTDKSEGREEDQIYTVALNGDELHHLKMIARTNLEENVSTRQILTGILSDQQTALKRVYDTTKAAQEYRENSDDICKYDAIRMTVSRTDVTAITTALSESPGVKWDSTLAVWRRSVRRLVDQVGWEWDDV